MQDAASETRCPRRPRRFGLAVGGEVGRGVGAGVVLGAAVVGAIDGACTSSARLCFAHVAGMDSVWPRRRPLPAANDSFDGPCSARPRADTSATHDELRLVRERVRRETAGDLDNFGDGRHAPRDPDCLVDEARGGDARVQHGGVASSHIPGNTAFVGLGVARGVGDELGAKVIVGALVRSEAASGWRSSPPSSRCGTEAAWNQSRPGIVPRRPRTPASRARAAGARVPQRPRPKTSSSGSCP